MGKRRLATMLCASQQRAIERALHETLVVITGGPGTGKTYTASALIRALAESVEGAFFKVAIAAPTGKAAAHLEAALHAQGQLPKALCVESTTLHRLLGLQPGKQRLKNPQRIDAHLVVVDEASMLDVGLMLHLFQAVGPQTRLLLLGDPDQLPPVDGASLFPDMAEALGIRLERSLRMERSELADAIQRGDVAAVSAHTERIPLELDAIKALIPSPVYASAPDPAMCLRTHTQLRVLSALRQGPLGADSLNRELLAHFQERCDSTQWLAIPILVTQNDPRLQLYNGSAGVLVRSTAYFQTAGGVRSLPEAALPRYEPAFCLSVHKSQGSEFDDVVVLLPAGSEQFGKEALYTAVTRAKRKVVLAADDATLAAMLASSSRSRNGFRERFLS